METTQTTQWNIPELMKQFNEQGYLLLRNAISQEKVDRLNSAIDEVVAGEPETLAHNIYNSVQRHEEIASLIDEPTLLPLVVNLLGYNIQLHISHLTIRKPNPQNANTETHSFINWHQDGPHPQFPRIDGITPLYYIKTCYILSDMSEPNRGNTKIIPGSHNRPYQPDTKNVTDELPGEMQVCGKPGDVFVFAQNLWHAGAPNHSSFTRRQLFLGYSPIWMRPIDYWAASDEMLKAASPIRKQLLGIIDDNPFKNYVPLDSMVPLKQMFLGDAGKGGYAH
jgi:ectoine hydroxylase-related dioxygenase (phytanoyl-CoA dioxygenase family)